MAAEAPRPYEKGIFDDFAQTDTRPPRRHGSGLRVAFHPDGAGGDRDDASDRLAEEWRIGFGETQGSARKATVRSWHLRRMVGVHIRPAIVGSARRRSSGFRRHRRCAAALCPGRQWQLALCRPLYRQPGKLRHSRAQGFADPDACRSQGKEGCLQARFQRP